MQLVASFLFHSVVAFDSRLTLTFAFRTEHIDTNHGKYTRSSLFWESDAKSGPWLEPMIITRLTSFRFFFKYSLKQRANMFLSVISLDLPFNTNILNTCTYLKHIDSALVQPVPAGPYVLSVSCQVKNELYLCIICITFSSHSIYCLVLRLSFC